MSVYDIKTKTRNVLFNQKKITPTFLFIALLTVLINYVGEILGGFIPFAPIITMLIVLPLSHGGVVACLMVVNERGDEIDIQNVGLTGFKRFKELFFTYFIHSAFMVVLLIFWGLILLLMMKFLVDGSFLEMISAIVFNDVSNANAILSSLSDTMIIQNLSSIMWLIFIGIIMAIVIIFVYNLYFILTPYILEKYKIYGIKAMSESARMMKGHKKTLFVLFLSYIGWIILLMIVATFIQIILPVSILATLLTEVVAVYLFYVQYQTSVTILFEEIDLEDKNLL